MKNFKEYLEAWSGGKAMGKIRKIRTKSGSDLGPGNIENVFGDAITFKAESIIYRIPIKNIDYIAE